VTLDSVHIPICRRPTVVPGLFNKTLSNWVSQNVENTVEPCLWAKDVGIVSAPSFPQIGRYPLPILGGFRGTLLNRFENIRHFVNIVLRVNEHMNVNRHKDIGKDREVVLLRSLVDAVGEGFAYSVIEQVLAAVVGREGYVVRMPERVERLALVVVRLSLSRNSRVLPVRPLVNISLPCLSSQLLRRRTKIQTERSGKQVTPRSKDYPAHNVTSQCRKVRQNTILVT
jgi:hypothetical protein